MPDKSTYAQNKQPVIRNCRMEPESIKASAILCFRSAGALKRRHSSSRFNMTGNFASFPAMAGQSLFRSARYDDNSNACHTSNLPAVCRDSARNRGVLVVTASSCSATLTNYTARPSDSR